MTVYFLLSLFVNGASGRTFNESIFAVPGLEVMASNDEKPHFTDETPTSHPVKISSITKKPH